MTATAQSYFTRIDDHRFLPTEHSVGAWREDELHLAPVAGLVIDFLERWRLENAPALVFSRVCVEVLGQIARAEIEIGIEVVRPGRTIELVEATAVIGGRTTLLARGWLLASSDTSAAAGHACDAMPSRADCVDESWLKRWRGGMIASVTAVQSAATIQGRAQAWASSEVALIEGESATPLGDYTKFLDLANGISWRQDPDEWMYPNVDLTLHLFRQPEGRWVGYDTRVAFGAGGLGLTSSTLHDEHGPVGMLAQSLTLRPATEL